jgi:hypothetical protein
MPFESLAQEGYMHAHPEILGKKALAEWDAATKGKKLPEHVKVHDEGGKVVVPDKDKKMAVNPFEKITEGDKVKKPPKHIKHIITAKTHDGKFIHTHVHHHPEHHPDETHVSNDMADLHNHFEDHAGTPNVGEAAPAEGAGPAPLTAVPPAMPQ